jgi:hypothetical protein
MEKGLATNEKHLCQAGIDANLLLTEMCQAAIAKPLLAAGLSHKFI